MDSARKGQEVCIKIEPIPGETPKLLGRHFEATDILVSKVREKVYFKLYMYSFIHFKSMMVGSGFGK